MNVVNEADEDCLLRMLTNVKCRMQNFKVLPGQSLLLVGKKWVPSTTFIAFLFCEISKDTHNNMARYPSGSEVTFSMKGHYLPSGIDFQWHFYLHIGIFYNYKSVTMTKKNI